MWRVAAVVVVVVVGCGAVDWGAEEEAVQLLGDYHKEAGHVLNEYAKALWDYATNITLHNTERKKEASARTRQFKDKWSKRSRNLADLDLTNDTRRMIKKAFQIQLNEEDGRNLSQVLSNMSTIYSTAQVCLHGKGCVGLDPDLTNLMANSRNYSELLEIWKGWRESVSREIKPYYLQYLDLMNKMARLNNFSDAGEMWRDKYETPAFEAAMEDLYKEVRPLYLLIHAYVRRRLRQHYPQIEPRGALPACVLGDMWGRFWRNISPLVTPYPDLTQLDVTSELVRLNHTPHTMFRMGGEFFTSMGLKPLPNTFWTRSMLVKPEGREVVCHPTAWDFYDGKDFRIKMCTQVNMEDLQTIHHELGHVQYFMEYAHLPLTYRNGANGGFHEAIGELVGMVVETPQYLTKIGLLPHRPAGPEMEVNQLMWAALQTVTTLPFHLVRDVWRWRVWRGDVEEAKYNEDFWRLMLEYAGVKPPVPRTDKDLDPPALFHVANNYDMIRYFTRTILQFQILEGLCRAAGHQGPLHTCDLHGSEKAGRLLASGLALGSSKPWPEVLKVLTGSSTMSTKPLREFFAPLEHWIRTEGLRDNETKESEQGVGWGQDWMALSVLGNSSACLGKLGINC
ncbi:angiotensin-converting enzyme-like isoform X5 [Portunus trituberculatus]|uniref:angiotensin-converting enzyme-like isoform X5 n=1 Tax=Portunus trituberculatus TaxID=210409 RepID=UPI001E1CC542|nr:angiotensin-converting enzyme-like isoform X5 [Portunus trituberculatus]